MKNILLIFALWFFTTASSKASLINQTMDFSDYQLMKLQNALRELSTPTTQSNNLNSAAPVSRKWQTKDEIIQALLRPSDVVYLINSPNFSYVSLQKLTYSSALNAKIKVSGFSAGVDLSLSKVVTSALHVQYFDPDVNYQNTSELKNVALYANGTLNQRIEEQLSGKDKENFWKKRMMVFSCAIDAEINLAEREDLAAALEVAGSSMGGHFTRGKDNIIRTSFITATVPVPIGFAKSINDRTHGTLITSFSLLNDICQNYVPNKIASLLDANLKADLASRVFQSDLTTCNNTNDCFEANDHWFTQWVLKMQKRTYFCEERKDLPGVKTCVKRGLVGASCSTSKSSNTPKCHSSLKCYQPTSTTYSYGAYYGYSPVNSAILYNIGFCKKP